MVLFKVLPPVPEALLPFVDSGLLVVILAPLLYGLVFRPMETVLTRCLTAEQALKESHEALETEVKDRTAALAAVNEKLQREVEDRSKAEALLRRLSSALLEAQEQERSRISRELHDSIGQSLSAVRFAVETAADRLGNVLHADEVSVLRAALPAIREAVDDLRRICMDLRPATLDDLGLVATISWFCRTFREIHPEIGISRLVEVEEEDVPERLKTPIYRVLQEAFNNTAKHANASSIQVRLHKQNEHLVLEVADNGRGMEGLLSARPCAAGGIGLQSMLERIEFSGGSMWLNSSLGEGLEIRAAWPLRARSTDDGSFHLA